MNVKTCRVCGLTKPVVGFRPHNMTSDGYANTCRDCHPTQPSTATPGEVYGKLTVVQEANRAGKRQRRVLVRCECGNIREVAVCGLRNGNVHSCQSCVDRRRECLGGDRFGRLLVVSEAPRRSDNVRRVIVRCDCGKEKDVSTLNLLSGGTQSCGCLHSETSRIRGLATWGKSRRKHGLGNHPLGSVYYKMRDRCSNPKNRAWKNYGGRGITLCDEWRESLEPFIEWAKENGHASGLHLDRIDNNGPYAPWNCRWVTPKVNARNKRNNRFIEAFGERKTAVEWAEDPRCRCDDRLIRQRIDQTGWDAERAIATPKICR